MIQRRKPKNSSPALDMNPMVDMAFLLVTFFLLATTFKTADPAKVLLPLSSTHTDLSEEAIVSITVTKDGRTFIGLEDPSLRIQWLERYGSMLNLEFTSLQKDNFAALPGLGVPRELLAEYLGWEEGKRRGYSPPGLPQELGNNQLEEWLIAARMVLPRARIIIKGDQNTPYKYIENLVETLTRNNLLRFYFVTKSKRTSDG
jgi:biopolymer transport protein ExbD